MNERKLKYQLQSKTRPSYILRLVSAFCLSPRHMHATNVTYFVVPAMGNIGLFNMHGPTETVIIWYISCTAQQKP